MGPSAFTRQQSQTQSKTTFDPATQYMHVFKFQDMDLGEYQVKVLRNPAIRIAELIKPTQE